MLLQRNIFHLVKDHQNYSCTTKFPLQMTTHPTLNGAITQYIFLAWMPCQSKNLALNFRRQPLNANVRFIYSQGVDQTDSLIVSSDSNSNKRIKKKSYFKCSSIKYIESQS